MSPRTLAAALALLLALPAGAVDMSKCGKDDWRDDRYFTQYQGQGLKFSVRRFCFGGTLDHKVQVCPKIENVSASTLEVKWGFVVLCRGGYRYEEAADARWASIKPGGKEDGGAWIENADCVSPCPEGDVPTNVGWRFSAVDPEAELREAARNKREADEKRRQEEQARLEKERREREEARRKEGELRAETQRKEQARVEREKADRAEEAKRRKREEEERRREEARRAEEERRREIRERYEREHAEGEARREQVKQEWGASGNALLGMQGEGWKALARGLGGRYLLELGVAGLFMPITYDATGFDLSSPYSSTTSTGGFGCYAAAELAPLTHRNYGLAAFAEGTVGFMPNDGGDQGAGEIAFGGRVLVGKLDRAWLILDAARLLHTGSYKADLGAGYADVTGEGEGDVSGRRLGIGGAFCAGSGEQACEIQLEAKIHFDRLAGSSATALYGSARWGEFHVFATYSAKYPVMNTPGYRISDALTDSMWIIGIGKTFTYKTWSWEQP